MALDGVGWQEQMKEKEHVPIQVRFGRALQCQVPCRAKAILP